MNNKNNYLRKISITVLIMIMSIVVSASSYINFNEDSVSSRAVGALFLKEHKNHQCTATVIESASKNLLLTAAHCLNGSGKNLTFVPAYNKGASPYGKWSISKIFMPDEWKNTRDSNYDYALLEVNKNNRRNIEEVTGSLKIKPLLENNKNITIPAYNEGVNDAPIKCSTKSFVKNSLKNKYLGFNCENYKGGVSGAPLVYKNNNKEFIMGIIGGLEQGGCTDDVSYSSNINMKIINKLMERASHSDFGDNSPLPPQVKCS